MGKENSWRCIHCKKTFSSEKETEEHLKVCKTKNFYSSKKGLLLGIGLLILGIAVFCFSAIHSGRIVESGGITSPLDKIDVWVGVILFIIGIVDIRKHFKAKD